MNLCGSENVGMGTYKLTPGTEGFGVVGLTGNTSMVLCAVLNMQWVANGLGIGGGGRGVPLEVLLFLRYL